MILQLRILFIFFSMMLLYSCEVFKPKAEIPAYLHIEKINLQVSDPNTQGSASQKITDAWIYVDDNLQGIYELPTTFPVIKNEKHSLKIKAGIKDNGISATRVQYPFYDFYTDAAYNFYPGKTDTLSPVVKYYSTVQFSWIEDFEDPGITIDSVYPSYMKMQRSINNLQVFEGNGSGYASVNSASPIFKGASNQKFILPKGGAEVYLELDYKTTTTLDVNIISYNFTGPAEDNAVHLNPTTQSGTAVWNKIYINISPIVSGNSSASEYQVIFLMNILGDTITSAEFYLDNIKLVHL